MENVGYSEDLYFLKAYVDIVPNLEDAIDDITYRLDNERNELRCGNAWKLKNGGWPMF